MIYLDEVRGRGISYLKSLFGDEAVENAVNAAARFTVEIPGWQFWAGFGGGGRFESGSSGGAARNTAEIARDAGLVNRLTLSTPFISQHMLWFFSEDGWNSQYEIALRVKEELEQNGVLMGAISPTYFLGGSEDGSFTSQDRSTRKRYIEQTALGARIAVELGNGILSLWFPDGTNYPGQRSLQEKLRLLKESTLEFWNEVPFDQKSKLQRILFEYKVFEPGTYSTTIPDWGTAREIARLVGDKGGVLVDLGHHQHGTNIEQIIASLIISSTPGGLHMNTRYAADDDHSLQADYELARIFNELVEANVIFNDDISKNWVFALDQMPRSEKRIPSILKSVDALKRTVAKAVLLNRASLDNFRHDKDLLKANGIFEKALLHADTAPIVMESYDRQGLHPDPLLAYYESGYQEKIERERK